MIHAARAINRCECTGNASNSLRPAKVERTVRPQRLADLIQNVTTPVCVEIDQYIPAENRIKLAEGRDVFQQVYTILH